jgi:hypothetical protein
VRAGGFPALLRLAGEAKASGRFVAADSTTNLAHSWACPLRSSALAYDAVQSGLRRAHPRLELLVRLGPQLDKARIVLRGFIEIPGLVVQLSKALVRRSQGLT